MYIPITVPGFIATALNIYALIIFVEVIVSWLIYLRKVSSYAGWVRGLRRITEPALEPVRRILPPSRTGNLDLSPMIVIMLLQFLADIVAHM